MAQTDGGRKPTFLLGAGKKTCRTSGRAAFLQAKLEERIGALAERIAQAAGLETAGVELRGGGHRGVLRVYLDRPGGAITLGDCEAVSRQLSAALDAEEIVPGDWSYTLEVSSPGLDRRLIKTADFNRFAGETVRVEMTPQAGRRRRLTGILEGLSGDEQKIRIRSQNGAEVAEIGREQVHSVRLVPHF